MLYCQICGRVINHACEIVRKNDDRKNSDIFLDEICPECKMLGNIIDKKKN